MITIGLLFRVVFVVVQLVFLVAGIALATTLLMAGLWEVGYKIQCALGWGLGYSRRKLTHLGHAFQGQRHEDRGGFRVADEYPPKPEGS